MLARAAVIGGGAAGLSCACELIDAGVEVTLFEARSRLGGRAFSFCDSQTGLVLDNCQHVILGCCERTLDFFAKIGSLEHVRFSDHIRLTDGNRDLIISPSGLPPPLHLLPSLVLTGYLTLRQKAALARVLAAMPRRKPSDRSSVADYLHSLSCPKELIESVFRPIAVAVLNEEPEIASAGYARMAVLETLLGKKNGFRLGITQKPLSRMLSGAAERYLRGRGCDIRLSCPVERVNVGAGRIESLILRGGECIEADVYVAAVPPLALEDMGLRCAARALLWRPIISAHFVFEGEAAEFDGVCVVGEPFGWVFNNSSGCAAGTVHLQAVASSANETIGWSNGDLAQLAARALRVAAPESQRWRIIRSIIVRQPRATFSTSAGSDALRPSGTTSLSNLFLAGDWTSTGWPSTLESAIRSGRLAAGAVLS